MVGGNRCLTLVNPSLSRELNELVGSFGLTVIESKRKTCMICLQLGWQRGNSLSSLFIGMRVFYLEKICFKEDFLNVRY